MDGVAPAHHVGGALGRRLALVNAHSERGLYRHDSLVLTTRPMPLELAERPPTHFQPTAGKLNLTIKAIAFRQIVPRLDTPLSLSAGSGRLPSRPDRSCSERRSVGRPTASSSATAATGSSEPQTSRPGPTGRSPKAAARHGLVLVDHVVVASNGEHSSTLHEMV